MKQAIKLIRSQVRPVQGLWLVTGITLLTLATNSQLIKADIQSETVPNVPPTVSAKTVDGRNAGTMSKSNEVSTSSVTLQTSRVNSSGNSNNSDMVDQSKQSSEQPAVISSSTIPVSDGNIISQSSSSISVSAAGPTSQSSSPKWNSESQVTSVATTVQTTQTKSVPAVTTKKSKQYGQSVAGSHRTILPVVESATVTSVPTSITTKDTAVIDGKTVVNYAGYDAVREAHEAALAAKPNTADPKKYGLMGTSEWWIDNKDQDLHVGAGTLADTDAKFDEAGNVLSWGNIGWHDIPNFKDHNFVPVFEGKIKVGADATGLFAHLYLQTESIMSNLLDTSQTQNMSYMFVDESAPLKNYNFSNLDTSRVTNMMYMFGYSRGFQALDVSSFKTPKVQNMRGMFGGLPGLEKLNLPGLDTSRVTDMADMFEGDEKLVDLDLSGFDTTLVTDMARMFSDDHNLQNLNLSSFNTKNVTNMAQMFASLPQIKTLDVSSFDTSQVTDMSKMFQGTFSDGIANQSIVGLDTFNTSRVTDMNSMFKQVNVVPGLLDGIDHFDTSLVTDMSHMFDGIHSAPNRWQLPLKTDNVLNMGQMFAKISDITTLDLSGFNTHLVNDMSAMFAEDGKLTKVIFSPSFKTGNVTDMVLMFFGDGALQSLDLSSFDMRKVQPGLLDINQYQISETLYTLGLFNAVDTLLGENQPTVKLRQLRLNSNSRLSFPGRIKSNEDIGDAEKIKANVGSQYTLDQYLLAILKILDVPDQNDLSQYAILQSAGLTEAAGLTGRWLNTRTGEALTADQLMDRYSDKNAALATTDTWIWQNIVGQDVQFIADKNAAWQPKDSFKAAVDDQGNQLNLADLNVTVNDAKTGAMIAPADLDLTQPGEYLVTFSLTPDSEMLQTSGPLRLSVLANQAEIVTHDSVIQLGTPWAALDNVTRVVGVNGQSEPVSLATLTVTVDGLTGTVLNTQVPGVHTVQYAYTDSLGTPHMARAVVVVNGLTLKSTIHQMTTDEAWAPLDNVALAVNDQGEMLAAKQVTVVITTADGQVVTKLNRPGRYTVTYQFSDDHGLHQQTAVLTVTAGTNHATLTVAKNTVELYTGDTWDARTNLVAARDADGRALNINRVQITDPVDVYQVGTYAVTYEFTDLFGQIQRQVTMVHVLADQADLQVKRSVITLRVGATWQPHTNLRLAVDSDGTPIMAERLNIDNMVNLTVVGNYQVRYAFTDLRGHLHVVTTDVRVLPNEAQLQLKQTVVQLTVGDAWDALANVLAARDVDGSSVPLDRVQISDPVNTATVGQYEVTYRFTDQQQRCQSAAATVTVSAPDVPVDPEKPVEPEVPVDPEKPVEPEVPVDPEKPVEPEVPVNPEKPVEPEVPADLEKPVEPEAPTDPERPVEPATPTTSTEPSVPITTAIPDQLSRTLKVALPITTELVSTPVGLASAQSTRRRGNNAPAQTSRVTHQSALPQTDEGAPANKVGVILLNLIALLTCWFPRRKR